MGRRWSKKNKKGRGNKGGEGGDGASATNSNSKTSNNNNAKSGNKNHRLADKNYTPSWQTNRRMEAYYAYQGMHNMTWNDETKSYQPCATEEEKAAEAVNWMATCRRILPASFRIGQDVDPIIRQQLEQELKELVGSEMDLTLENGQIIQLAPAKRIAFVPHAYQLSVDRHTIKKNKSLGALFEWLKIQTDAGFVTRQETVSMIPPIVMHVQSHHQVLDMCAAPGSKTSQILEMVSHIPKGHREPIGCVVANDADPKRAYMLVHQLKRIQSPVALVTSCDAQFFPLLKNFTSDNDTTSTSTTTPPSTTPPSTEGMFDRVLADVPCSGDGTMRKNPGVWKSWSALNSYALHPLQIAIALNGARLTKVGGYLCYSTCTMSPIENEAVVAELLRATDGSLELVDRRQHLTDIKGRPGWSSWKVLREENSLRRTKAEKKKHNAKMRERKRLYELHGKKTWLEAEQDKQGETTSKEGATTETGEESKENNGNANTNGDAETVVDPFPQKKAEEPHEPLGPPASWDEAFLQERCHTEGFTEYNSYDEVEEKWQRSCRSSVFPPTPEEAATMHLEKCLRFLPHDMDTSGFFVALFKKTQPLSQKARAQAAKLASELRTDIADVDGREGPPAKKRAKPNEDETKKSKESDNHHHHHHHDENKPDPISEESMAEDTVMATTAASDAVAEEPVGKIVKGKTSFKGHGAPKGNMGNENFVQVCEENLAPLIPHYGFGDDLPKDQYMSRGSADSKIIYFIGKSVKNYFDAGLQDRVTIINSGLKAFEKNSYGSCEVKYRVTQEGVHYQAPYMTKRTYIVTIKDFIKCLNKGAIPLSDLSSDLADKIRPLTVGSFMVALEGFEEDLEKKFMMVLWRCRGDTFNCLVSKIERDGMRSKLRAITGEELPAEDDSADIPTTQTTTTTTTRPTTTTTTTTEESKTAEEPMNSTAVTTTDVPMIDT